MKRINPHWVNFYHAQLVKISAVFVVEGFLLYQAAIHHLSQSYINPFSLLPANTDLRIPIPPHFTFLLLYFTVF